jgi:hypothetical protein
MCGEWREPGRETTFEVRVRIHDVYHEGEANERLNVVESLEDTYGEGEVEVLEYTEVSATDPTTGIKHFAGAEG